MKAPTKLDNEEMTAEELAEIAFILDSYDAFHARKSARTKNTPKDSPSSDPKNPVGPSSARSRA